MEEGPRPQDTPEAGEGRRCRALGQRGWEIWKSGAVCRATGSCSLWWEGQGCESRLCAHKCRAMGRHTLQGS